MRTAGDRLLADVAQTRPWILRQIGLKLFLRLTGKQDFTSMAQSRRRGNGVPTHHLLNLGAAAHEVFESDNHLAASRQFNFTARVFRGLYQQPDAVPIFPNSLQQLKSGVTVATPETL